ncbi:hypothetical protein SB659_09680 [Arthrobacter sp. SIMBA_036]|uniref:hypothetical protein n=1 Tax=Arthrobacter sp. SIMBA_036 TaxID=3085778 RepID=UPI0039789465
MTSIQVNEPADVEEKLTDGAPDAAPAAPDWKWCRYRVAASVTSAPNAVPYGTGTTAPASI